LKKQIFAFFWLDSTLGMGAAHTCTVPFHTRYHDNDRDWRGSQLWGGSNVTFSTGFMNQQTFLTYFHSCLPIGMAQVHCRQFNLHVRK